MVGTSVRSSIKQLRISLNKGVNTRKIYIFPLVIIISVCGACGKIDTSLTNTKKDWAEHVEELLEVHYSSTPKVCLGMDNLNTHAISSLYITIYI